MKQKWILITLVIFALTACTSPDHEAMRQRLKYVSDCNRADTVFTERWLPAVDSLVAFFDRHGSANERMMAHYVQGRVHHDMGEAPQALECYQKAAEQADTTSSDCDFYTLTAIYGQMAVLFHSQYLPTDEMYAIMRSEHFALKDGDTLSAIKAYELRERPYYLQSDTNKVMAIKVEVRNRYIKLGEQEKAARTFRVPISIYLDRCQYEQAQKAMRIFEKESGWFDDSGNIKKGKELYYYDKGRYELSAGNLESALSYFEKALMAGKKEAGYKGLLSVYEKKNIADSISKYARLFASANDSSYLHVNQQQVEQVRSMYNYNRQQQIAHQKEKEVSRLQYIIIIIIIIVVAVILLSALLFYFYRSRKLSKFNQLMEKKTELENLLTEKMQELELNKSNAEIVSEEQYDEIVQLRKQIRSYQERLSDNITGKQRLFYDSEIYRYFMSFKTNASCGKSPSNQEWQAFVRLFRESFPRYHQFIAEENHLTPDQYRICLLVRLFLPVYAMARILDVDGDRITRIKAQVNKKLFGEDTAKTLESKIKPFFDEQV